MPVIDADTHIDETEDTWAFLRDGDEALRPTTAYPKGQDASNAIMRYWMIDGKRQIRFVRTDEETHTTEGARELTDVKRRLADMDRMGVDYQVMYPTLFLVEFTDKPEIELALRRSYNRWMADRWAESEGRLRWVMLPPTQNLDAAPDELRFAKEHGACGVLKKGDREAGVWANDPYFFPMYEEAQKLDMPICFHTGSGVPDFTPAREFTFSRFYRILLPVVHAFQSLIVHGVPERFPTLRFGFIEATASWVPFVLYEIRRRLEKNKERPTSVLRSTMEIEDMPEDILQRNRMYVSFQVDEDLSYVVHHTGEDNLLVGSDYTHNDSAQEMDFLGLLKQRADKGDISHSAVTKITQDNPKNFYGI